MSAMFPAPVLAQGGRFDPAVLDKLAEEMREVLDAMPPEKRKATEEVATKHGFKNLEEWIAVTNSVAVIENASPAKPIIVCHVVSSWASTICQQESAAFQCSATQ